jgi:Tfp pilus assembly protein PilO
MLTFGQSLSSEGRGFPVTRVYMLLGALAAIGVLLGAAYLKGLSDGRWAERVAQLEAIEELNQQLDAKDAELAALEAARLKQMRELEDRVEELRRQADEDPNADRPAFGPDSMRRLNAVGGP